MNTVHVLWIPSPTPRLYVWCESGAFMPRGPSKKQGGDFPLFHPFAASHAVLPEILKPLISDDLIGSASYETLNLSLPSLNGKPLASDFSFEDTAPIRPRFETWKVQALAFGISPALEFLIRPVLPAADSLRRGASFEAFREASLAVLFLIRERCFTPFIHGEGNTVFGGWKLLFSDRLSAALSVFAQALPEAAVCVPECSMPKVQLLSGFMNAAADAFLRNFLAQDGEGLFSSVEEEWVKSLAAPPEKPRPIRGPEDEIRSFKEKLSQWLSGGSGGGWRLLFRLEEPPETQGDWELNFFLQALEDKSLLIPASKIARRDPQASAVFRAGLEKARAVLISELSKAALLFPALLAPAGQASPEKMTMHGGEAYDFLRKYALMLQAKGFGVHVPSWWHEKKRRITAVLRIRPMEERPRGGMNEWLQYDWAAAAGGERLSMEEFRAVAALKMPLVKIRGVWTELRLQEIENTLAYFQKKEMGGAARMPLSQALRIALAGDISEIGIPVSGIEAEGWAAKLLGMIDPSAPMELLKAAKGFQGVLRPYQVRGFSWLAFLREGGFGACLADDMGLGKTVQVLAMLLHFKENLPEGGPALLICPASIVSNWRHEAGRFTPGISVMVHHGGKRLSSEKFLEEAGRADLVITTYALAFRDQETLRMREWACVILDEAQNIKNESSKQAQAVKSLTAFSRIALTGTPIENRLSELWSIMDFLNPGYLGSLAAFRERFENAIERRGDPEKTETLRKLVQPFILRRLKTDKSIIGDLPEKMEMKVYCDLTGEQASLYKAVVDEMLLKIAAASGIQRKGLILSALTQLKQVCNHPAHYLKDKSALGERSGKVNRLSGMLEEAVSEGDKALVFTQFTEMGELLESHLAQVLSRTVLFYHGGLNLDLREEILERFRKDDGAAVLLVTTKAGGTGLNLTAANHVFHFDRWWNPAVENQATDRAFRIGQTKNVMAHKFVCAGTVEEKIDEMMTRKAALAETVMTSGEDFLTEMTTDELRGLLMLSNAVIAE